MGRVCGKCSIDLNDHNWWPSSRKRNYNVCNLCDTLRQREYANKRPDVHLAKAIKKYGLSYEDYCSMLSQQAGVCAICGNKETYGRKKNLSVDHCHTTGRIRGLLCSSCNIGLGKFKEDTALLEKALEYLRC